MIARLSKLWFCVIEKLRCRLKIKRRCWIHACYMEWHHCRRSRCAALTNVGKEIQLIDVQACQWISNGTNKKNTTHQTKIPRKIHVVIAVAACLLQIFICKVWRVIEVCRFYRRDRILHCNLRFVVCAVFSFATWGILRQTPIKSVCQIRNAANVICVRIIKSAICGIRIMQFRQLSHSPASTVMRFLLGF